MNTRTEVGLIRAHGFAALAMVVYSALLGVVVALKFHWPDLLSETPWLTWGRLRYAHTQGIFFGWLGNAFLAFLYYAIPRLAGRPATSRAVGWLLFFVWNFLLVIPGWILVQAGYSQGLEFAEFPLPVDAAATAGFLLSVIQFVLPLLRGPITHLYVSGWYILGALVFTLFAYPVGNIVPELTPGAKGATYSGLWIHDAVGLYITPLAVAIAYIVIPATTGRPIYSHFLSMVGFWLLFLVYPLNGTHHYVFSSIPMEAQKGAIIASVYLGVDVILVVTNQLLSMRGSGGKVVTDIPLRFVWLGTVIYLIVSLQGSMQALMPVNRFVHFTDWVIGHSHLAMIGFASFTAIGGLLFAWSRVGLPYNRYAAGWAFWLLTMGLGLMFLDLTIAGLVQGQMWQSDAAWIDSVKASSSYWIVRSVSGFIVLAGFLMLPISMATRSAASTEAPDQPTPASPTKTEQVLTDEEAGGAAWLQNAYVVTAVAGFGLFLFSFFVLAIWPNQTLDRQIAETRPANSPPLTASEQHGRAIYIREGCMNCHSQLVRFTEDDVRRFGVAGQAWESEHDYPQLWGTRRIGPDLSRESGRKSRDWHLAHLWNPRHVVPESIMPSHAWLFEGSPQRPTSEALDLVAYMDSLGRDAKLAGVAGPQSLPGVDPAEERRRGMFCDCAIPRTAGAAPLFPIEGLPKSERERFALRGAKEFASHCAGCHGDKGIGDGPAAVSLSPAPRNLTTARFSDRAVSQTLWNGVKGSAMPPFNDLSLNDLRSLTAYVESLEPAAERPEPPLAKDRLVKARNIFTANCSVCHGAEGAGDGISAANLFPSPTNFHEIQPTLAYAEATLAAGVPGTAMPNWRRLPAEERSLLSHYVRTLYQSKAEE